MKSLLKVLYIALVGAVVFTGALFIVRGLRENASAGAQEPDARPMIEFQEGSAL